MTLRVDGSEGFPELAVLLAHGFLRLTQKRPNDAVFPTGEPQNCLDSLAPESTPVVQETPRWKRACSVKSTASGR